MTQAVVQVRNIVARSGFANPLTLEVLVADEDYLKVYADTTLLDNGTDYEITGIGDPNGISIEIIGAEDPDNYVGVETFTALYDPPYDQQSDLSAGGVLGRGFETGLDQQNRRLQALGDRVDRSLKVNVNIDGDIVLNPVDGQIPMWDEDTQQFIFIESVPSAQAEASAAAAAASAAAAALSAADAETEADAAAASAVAAAASAAAAAIAETAAELAETNAEAAEVAAEAAQAAAEAAVANAVAAVADLTALEALDPLDVTVAHLKEAAREGMFQWNGSNLSAEVTADTDQDRYVAPASAPTGASGAWVRVGAVATGSYWENDAPRARIHRLADRVLVGDAAANDGLPNTAGSWLYQQGAGANKMSWIERNAVLAGVTSTGAVAVTGAARNEDDGAALGVIGFATTKPGGVSTAGSWGGYFEALRASVASKAIGVEIDITNLFVSPISGGLNPYDPYLNGGTRALWVASGGDVTVNPTTFPADIAIGVVNNGNTFNSGLTFFYNALERDGGATGRAHAIRLSDDHAIEWYEPATETLAFSLVSQVADATHKQELRASNSGLILYNNAAKPTFQVLYVGTSVNYPRLEPSATGDSVNLRASGDDTDIHLAFFAKGTGGVVPGTNDGAALGASGRAWSDLFLASGSVINWDAGDVTLTHAANTLAFAGGTNYTFDNKVSIVGSAAFFNALEMQSTNDDANAGPYFLFYRNSASPANNDTGGTMIWQFKNSTPAQFNAATIDARMLDTTAGGEDVSLRFTVSVNGANNHVAMQIQNGVQIGAPTTGFMGLGTLNLDNDLYKDGLKVVGARKTGWGVPTGTLTRTTFVTSTVTLPQLAERVAALIADLEATNGHGLIAA